MPDPVVVQLTPQAAYDRKVQLARKIVIGVACFVVLSLVVAVVFAAYGLATERPVKELFLGPSE